jgi:membrane fusion protein, multidrug efflux system
VTTRPDCRPASKTTRIASVAASALLAACMLGACSDKSGAQAQAKKSVPTVPVLIGQVVEKSMPLRLHAIGNVETVASVAIKSRVDGQIIVTHVRDGQDLVKGDPLFQIDQKPYQSQLEQAQANLARDEAQLEYLRGQEQRYQDLLKQNFVSKEGYAQVAANFHGAQASVTADEAAVQNARINLGYTTIRSPINGRAGKVMLSEGNMVKANDTVAMVVINQLTPIYVSVAVPEQFLNEIRARQKSAPLRVQVELEKGKAIGGKLAFVDNSVDVATGTIKLRGIFSNDDKQLWPGQFVESWVTLRDEEKAVVVPTQALQTGPNGQYVYVVKEDSSVELRVVQVARTESAETVVAGGLKPGETVVVDGASRILPGSKVSAKSPDAVRAPDARPADKTPEKS